MVFSRSPWRISLIASIWVERPVIGSKLILRQCHLLLRVLLRHVVLVLIGSWVLLLLLVVVLRMLWMAVPLLLSHHH